MSSGFFSKIAGTPRATREAERVVEGAILRKTLLDSIMSLVTVTLKLWPLHVHRRRVNGE